MDRAILVRDRLIASREVDDREPPGREADTPVHEHASTVGAPVKERLVHALEDFRIDWRALHRDHAAHTAHRLSLVGLPPTSSPGAKTCGNRLSVPTARDPVLGGPGRCALE